MASLLALFGTWLGGGSIRAQRPTDDFWYTPVGMLAAAGVRVTPDQALRMSVVYACCRVLGETVGALPLITYERLSDGGKARAATHPLYDLLRYQPNQWQTAYEFWRLMVVTASLYGNGYALIRAGERGFASSLEPVHPRAVYRVTQLADKSLRYHVREANGTERTYLQDEMLHISGLSVDGVLGLGIPDVARDAIGLALATEQYGSSFFRNGGSPSAILQHPGKLSPEAQARLRQSFNATYSGAANAHKLMILEEAMKFERMGQDSDKAQFTETRAFQAEDVARSFRMPLHKIGILTHATFSNIEHQAIEFVTDTIYPWCVSIEQRVRLSLLAPPHRFYTEFLLEGLLRGDSAARASFYASGIVNGWLTRNEARERENMNRLSGLDQPLRPLNMGDGSGESEARLLGIVRESAARLVRREQVAVRKAVSRGGQSADGLRSWLTEFYDEHAGLIAETLKVDVRVADRYCAGQIDSVISGVSVDTWGASQVDALLEITLERSHALAIR